MTQLETIGYTVFLYSAILVILEIAQRCVRVSAEIIRKLAHISIGLTCLYTARWYTSHWHVLLLTSVFLGILILSKQRKWLKSLHAIKRKSYGDFFFPVVMYITFLVYQHYNYNNLLFIPMLVMTLADPAAFFAGRLWAKQHYAIYDDIPDHKTIPGVIAFFAIAMLSSFFITFVVVDYPVGRAIALSISVAILTTPAEYYSRSGWDNFIVPMVAAFVLIVYLESGI